MIMSEGWECHPVKEAIASQEEMIKRIMADRPEAERPHDFETEGGEMERHDSKCAVCGQTRTATILHR